VKSDLNLHSFFIFTYNMFIITMYNIGIVGIYHYIILLSNSIYLGSDLAGETSAALSAVSIVFNKIDSNFSASCLSHAKQLYLFATQYRGLYHDAIKGAAQYYE